MVHFLSKPLDCCLLLEGGISSVMFIAVTRSKSKHCVKAPFAHSAMACMLSTSVCSLVCPGSALAVVLR